ncbi:hypothetical protein BDK51DRAFT_46215 [Blyttiomyces helicus]|uniref:Uncharacterized protein n=1 Tax=Blyttiomyces helicus TaxID=388810 RepID=A0A4P9WMA3_9FUNG|nr:hypothetical protein BDK51DRAFT_46215 [Blyttiomyces helicus]|eukprot:RKO94044.1 hypothetical protein BDK51DRAFT_46215 [Blyttiomyces helicus]
MGTLKEENTAASAEFTFLKEATTAANAEITLLKEAATVANAEITPLAAWSRRIWKSIIGGKGTKGGQLHFFGLRG